MPWVKIDDHFSEHPKHARVGPPGWGYWLAGLAYANRNLTDGFIPHAVAYSLATWTVWIRRTTRVGSGSGRTTSGRGCTARN